MAHHVVWRRFRYVRHSNRQHWLVLTLVLPPRVLCQLFAQTHSATTTTDTSPRILLLLSTSHSLVGWLAGLPEYIYLHYYLAHMVASWLAGEMRSGVRAHKCHAYQSLWPKRKPTCAHLPWPRMTTARLVTRRRRRRRAREQ